MQKVAWGIVCCGVVYCREAKLKVKITDFQLIMIDKKIVFFKKKV